MAGGMDLGTGGKGKKKPLDTAINLVPFIDLMAVTISFLIMTAVWTQISKLQVTQAGGPSDAPPDDKPPSLVLNVVVTEGGFRLTNAGVPLPDGEIAKASGTYDWKKLEERLKKLRADNQDLHSVTVQSEDAIKYVDLVKVIDTCYGVDLKAVTVSAAG